MDPFLELPTTEGTTFPAYASHADLVRAWYSANYGIELKSLTRESWALSGADRDQSHPVTDAGAPDFARFSGREHFLDYIRTADVWQASSVVALFNRLQDADLDFLAGCVVRASVRPSNSREAYGAALDCINLAARRLVVRAPQDAARFNSTLGRHARKLDALHTVSAN